MTKINIGALDDVKQSIRSRLLSAEMHDIDNLARRHVAGDVWQTWFISLPSPDGYAASWGITTSMLDMWSITIDDLEHIADENEANTATVQRMADVLQSYLDTPPWKSPTEMVVVSRRGGWCGASAVLSDDVRSKLTEVFPAGCYILPSSVHEVIAVSMDHNAYDLAEMVRTINKTEVAENDRLSDHVFRFTAEGLSVAA